MQDDLKIAVILVAGGIGSRMRSIIPKQYLHIEGRPIVDYSFALFASMPEISEIVVVCAKEYRSYFQHANDKIMLTFAEPGLRRQDSVYNGLQALQREASLICVHDAVRPCITVELVRRVIQAAAEYGAATAAMPLKFTLKQADEKGFVQRTLDRSLLWEIQTPQVMKKALFEKGFEKANEAQITVTDDVLLIELLGHPVKLVEGSYNNVKVTTPEDLFMCERVLGGV